ncbi:MAG TPA: 23S rRNA (pseudouridine(1915)-N(3))-methyltransferase RlmH [Ruminococcaceae bacterium]|jgi:23S rRNA (pseudouridine1915-N3)-methyltransferase|nr:23S rRNA (pseudouridine(1915)-N(3))-methyltransferase RlmH [Oscillospiraceae bacterium]HCA29586.1 23S rRNA (pseudouridine(1915)-N(3))-methyltransferase RlmH [Oscillospiraceae bacterium]
MRNVTVACVGKLKESYLRDACAEYIKRLGGFCKISIIEVDEERLPEKPSQSQIINGLMVEGRRLLAKTDSGSIRIPLCIEGESMSSPKLAQYLDGLAIHGHGNVTFLIGGSLGLSDEVKASTDFKLSMSPMTFPHQLARVMLLEQIYRAFQISSGGKYHK